MTFPCRLVSHIAALRVAGAAVRRGTLRRYRGVAAAAGIVLVLSLLATAGASVAAAPDSGSVAAGIVFAPLDPASRTRLGIDANLGGAVVASIAADSPLARLGIARGDIIEAINEEAVDAPERAAARIARLCRGKGHDESLSILLNRRGVHRLLVDPGWCRNAAPVAGESAR